jgi:hypothetical protein
LKEERERKKEKRNKKKEIFSFIFIKFTEEKTK